jgi:1-phosphatidylinositol phosphodiesterase
MTKILYIFIIIVVVHSQSGPYNHNSNSNILNQTWMASFGDSFPLVQLNLIGTYSTMSFLGNGGDAIQFQSLSLTTQISTGIRIFDIRCNHQNDLFKIYQNSVYQNFNFTYVLSTMQNYLTTYPS